MKKLLFAALLLPLSLGGCGLFAAGPVSLCGCASPEQRLFALVTTLYTGPDDFQKENDEEYRAATGPEGKAKPSAPG